MNTSPLSRPQVEAALQGAIDAVDSQFVTRQLRPGEHMTFTADPAVHESAIARGLLPRLSGTHLGRLISTYGNEFIKEGVSRLGR